MHSRSAFATSLPIRRTIRMSMAQRAACSAGMICRMIECKPRRFLSEQVKERERERETDRQRETERIREREY